MEMICFKLIPLSAEKCVNSEKARLRDLVEVIKEHLEDGYIVVVNGRIISDLNYVVTSNDTVVFVKEFMGG